MKYIIAAIFLAVSIQSFGQFNKGDKVLGGTLSFNTAKNENSQYGNLTSNSTSFGIYPNFGVLINSNLEIGGQLGYSSNHNEWSATDASSDRKSNYLTAGFYMRRYFVISDKFLFSLMGNISYSVGKDKTLLTNQNVIDEDQTKGKISPLPLGRVLYSFPRQIGGYKLVSVILVTRPPKTKRPMTHQTSLVLITAMSDLVLPITSEVKLSDRQSDLQHLAGRESLCGRKFCKVPINPERLSLRKSNDNAIL